MLYHFVDKFQQFIVRFLIKCTHFMIGFKFFIKLASAGLKERYIIPLNLNLNLNLIF